MYLGNEDIIFLNNAENRVMQHLVAAYKEFYDITMKDQQHTLDMVDFGHYLSAAQHTLLIRGARRMDPDNLLKNTARYPSDMNDIIGED